MTLPGVQIDTGSAELAKGPRRAARARAATMAVLLAGTSPARRVARRRTRHHRLARARATATDRHDVALLPQQGNGLCGPCRARRRTPAAAASRCVELAGQRLQGLAEPADLVRGEPALPAFLDQLRQRPPFRPHPQPGAAPRAGRRAACRPVRQLVLVLVVEPFMSAAARSPTWSAGAGSTAGACAAPRRRDSRPS